MRHATLLRLASCLAFVFLAAACASDGGAAEGSATTTSAKAPTAAAPAWRLEGWRVIGCCCPTPCPCRLDKKPTHCHGCDHTDIVHIDQGMLQGIAMGGVTYVLVGRGFGEDANGNWVYCYVDEKASEAQVGALTKMLNDTVAAWGAKAPHLAGKFVGMRKVPMTVRADGEAKGYGVTIPGVLDFQTKTIYNPGHTEPVISTGIMDSFGDRFVHADAVVHTLKDPAIGYEWDLTGRQANHTTFVLDQKRIDQGGIGWGCWTANAAFGDTAKYGEQQIGHQ